MVFARHNEKLNYFNATGSKDPLFAKDLVLNDLANIIIQNKPMVINAVKHAGIAIDDKAKNKVLVAAVIENVDSNKQLKNNLAKLITVNHATRSKAPNRAGGNLPATQSKHLNAAGDQPASGNNFGNVLKSLGSLFIGVGEMVAPGNKQAIAEAQEANKQKLNDLIIAKNGGASDEMSSTTNLVIGIGAVGIIGFLIYLAVKK